LSKLSVVLIVLIFFLAIVFGIFTLSLLVTTLNLIRNNTSTIDQKQCRQDVQTKLSLKIPPVYKEKPSFYKLLSQVMGKPGPLHLLWLLPINFMESDICIEDELNFNYV
jgi:hypothetical protein